MYAIIDDNKLVLTLTPSRQFIILFGLFLKISPDLHYPVGHVASNDYI